MPEYFPEQPAPVLSPPRPNARSVPGTALKDSPLPQGLKRFDLVRELQTRFQPAVTPGREGGVRVRTWIGVWDDAGTMGRAYRGHAAGSLVYCSGGLFVTNYMPPAEAANLGNPMPFRSLELEQGRRGQIRPNTAR